MRQEFLPNPTLIVPDLGDIAPWFDVQRPEDIRITGHRIGIETVLSEYLDDGKKPEEIAEKWTSLTLDEVQATIRLYERFTEFVTAYMENWRAFCRSPKVGWPYAPPLLLSERVKKTSP